MMNLTTCNIQGYLEATCCTTRIRLVSTTDWIQENMKKLLLSVIVALFSSTICHGSECLHELQMSMRDTFCIEQKANWDIEVEKLLTLRFADVRITPNDRSFSLMLYFKADTPDLAQFDSPEKIKISIFRSSEKYLPYVVEKEIKLEKFTTKGSYGFINILTDKELANQTTLEEGQFKYLSRGMVRLSKDSALGFSLMTNEIKTIKYKELTDYILSFIKN